MKTLLQSGPGGDLPVLPEKRFPITGESSCGGGGLTGRLRLTTWGAVWIVVVVLASHLKILTYVTGQDPVTYIQMARVLLDGGFSLAAWREVAAFIAPGYPALLAVVMAVGGVMAAFWVNGMLVAGSLLLFYRLCLRWGMTPWSATVAVLVSWGLIIGNYELNAHFLLYPFRGAVQYFFMLVSITLVDAARPGGRFAGGWLSGAVWVLLVGAFFRETTLLLWPGLFLWLWLARDWRGHRTRAMLWLLAPVVFVVLLFGALYLSGWVGTNQQSGTWAYFGRQFDLQVYLDRLGRYLTIFWHSSGFWGRLALGLGLWYGVRRPGHLGWSVIPAFLLLLFYAVFMVHMRYLLDATFLLALLSGLGVADLVHRWVKRLPSTPQYWVNSGMVLAVTVFCGIRIMALPMWGPRVSDGDIRAFRQAVTEYAGQPEQALVLDSRCRYLVDTATLYGNRPLIYSQNENPKSFAKAPFPLFFRPENRTYWPNTGELERTEWLETSADLIPVTHDDGQPLRVALGDLSYTLFYVTPWQHTDVSEPIRSDHWVKGLLWLDFRRSRADALREIELYDDGGQLLASRQISEGNGLIPLAATEDWMPHASRLEVHSSDLLPNRLISEAPPWNHDSTSFPLNSERRFSSLDWVVEPMSISPDAKWGAVFCDHAGYRIPYPVGMTDGVYSVTFELEPRYRQNDTVVFAYSSPGEDSLLIATNLLNQSRIRHTVKTSAPFDGAYWPIAVSVTTPASFDNHFRVVSLAFEAE